MTNHNRDLANKDDAFLIQPAMMLQPTNRHNQQFLGRSQPHCASCRLCLSAGPGSSNSVTPSPLSPWKHRKTSLPAPSTSVSARDKVSDGAKGGMIKHQGVPQLQSIGLPKLHDLHSRKVPVQVVWFQGLIIIFPNLPYLPNVGPHNYKLVYNPI